MTQDAIGFLVFSPVSPLAWTFSVERHIFPLSRWTISGLGYKTPLFRPRIDQPRLAIVYHKLLRDQPLLWKRSFPPQCHFFELHTDLFLPNFTFVYTTCSYSPRLTEAPPNTEKPILESMDLYEPYTYFTFPFCPYPLGGTCLLAYPKQVCFTKFPSSQTPTVRVLSYTCPIRNFPRWVHCFFMSLALRDLGLPRWVGRHLLCFIHCAWFQLHFHSIALVTPRKPTFPLCPPTVLERFSLN